MQADNDNIPLKHDIRSAWILVEAGSYSLAYNKIYGPTPPSYGEYPNGYSVDQKNVEQKLVDYVLRSFRKALEYYEIEGTAIHGWSSPQPHLWMLKKEFDR